MGSKRKLLLVTTSALLSATAGMAQDVPAADTGLSEIVVTAQRRAESLQSVPIAVTAVTGDMVDNLKATSLQGLQGMIPNTQITNFTNAPNSAVFFIRGIGVIDPDPFAGNTVAIVQDGVSQYFSMGALLDMFDVDRVEVLKGPQGTLFGANTTGGVVNVTTRQPTGEFGGRGEITYGNRNRLDVKAAVDFPIIENVLAGKVAAMHTGRDGYFTNIVDGRKLGDRDTTVVRAYLKYTPDPDLAATLSGEYGRTRNGSPVFVNGAIPGDLLYVPGGTITQPGQAYPMYPSPCPPDGGSCSAPDRYFTTSDSGVPDQSNMDTYRATLTINLDNTAIGDITSITGYKKFTLAEFNDQDSLVGLFLDTYRRTEGWQFSQEVRTSVDLTDDINLLIGGSYLNTHYDHLMNLRLQFAVPGLRQYNPQDQDNWSGSLFAHTFVDLTDRLRLQAGIRYTHEWTRMVAGLDNYISPTGTALLCTTASDCGDDLVDSFSVRRSEKWNNFGWKFGLDYEVASGTLLYGYYARGFKSGGFVGRLAAPSDVGPYDPEKVDTVEAGIKSELFDRRVRANLAAFYTSYRDMQVAQNYIVEGGTAIGTSIFNAAKSKIKGAELEIAARATDGLTLNGSLAYLDAKYREFQFFDANCECFIDLKGKSLQNSPKWSATAGATYELPLGPGHLRANAVYSYTGSKYFQGLQNIAAVRIQPMHYVHGNLSWSPDNGDWTMELWVRNLLDNRYMEAVTRNFGIYNQAGYTQPREFGATFKFEW